MVNTIYEYLRGYYESNRCCYCFIGVPLVVVPFLKSLDKEPPKTTDKKDHIIIATDNLEGEVLRQELDEFETPYVVVEQNRDKAKDMHTNGIPVVHADPKSVEGLNSANLKQAKAIVADLSDEENPTVILSSEQINPDIYQISVVNDSDSEIYNKLSGADRVFNGKHQLGEALGMQAITSIPDEYKKATNHSITEIRIKEGSSIVGETVQSASSKYFDESVIIGGWFNRKFLISPDKNKTIPKNTIL